MTNTDLFYELSSEADKDLEEIFNYTESSFGTDQAVKYVSSFEQAFQQILKNSEIGYERKEIREGLRSIIKDKHVIFYRILNDRIRIIRILHGSRDLPKAFSN